MEYRKKKWRHLCNELFDDHLSVVIHINVRLRYLGVGNGDDCDTKEFCWFFAFQNGT
jgi:hypothetical protein